jgi:hypothetical protein
VLLIFLWRTQWLADVGSSSDRRATFGVRLSVCSPARFECAPTEPCSFECPSTAVIAQVDERSRSARWSPDADADQSQWQQQQQQQQQRSRCGWMQMSAAAQSFE